MLRSQMTDAAPAQLVPLDRQLLILGELAEVGLQAARAIGREAEEGQTDVAEIALAYARVSRAVRLAIMLQTELLKPQAPPEPPDERLTPEYGRKVRLERIVERLATAEHPDDEDRVDDLVRQTGDRLDDEDLYGDLMQRPLSELVARICADLGLEPDWPGLAKEFWAQEEVKSNAPGSPLTPYLPREAAGGGPLAEERGVEGAGGERHASASLLHHTQLNTHHTGLPPPPSALRSARPTVPLPPPSLSSG